MSRLIETKENEEIGLYTKDSATGNVIRVGEFHPNGGGLTIGSAGVVGNPGSEGDNIKFHRGGAKVLQVVVASDQTPDGVLAPHTSLAKIQGVAHSDYIVGSVSQYLSGEATHSSLESAVSGSSSGAKILVIGKTGDLITSTVTVTNKVFIEGVGSDSEINCNLIMGYSPTVSSSKSLIKNLRFLGDLTIEDGSNNNIITDCWIVANKEVTDLNSSPNNLITILQENE